MAGIEDDAFLTAWTLLQDFLLRAQDESFLAELAERLDDELVAEMPELAAQVSMRATLDASTRALLREFFRAYAVDPSAPLEIPSEVLAFGQGLALRRLDVGVLLRAYRIGQRVAWAELTTILASEIPDAELRIVVMSAMFDRMSRELERVVEASVTVFTEERDRWLTGSLARKSDLIAALLRGEDVDADEATRTLGHRLHHQQLALLLWSNETAPQRESLGRLEAAADAAAALFKAPPPLMMPDSGGSLQVWLNVSSGADPTRLDRLAAKVDAGVLVAAGLPTYGAAGFRTSHRQALLASRVARASSAPRPITTYADVAPVAAFLDDPEAMHDLVARELGGLCRRDEPTGRLRETALAYLRAAGSARDASESIGVHKNTVLYRLRAIEDALGHGLDERRLPLQLALEIAEQLGENALPAG